jgi:hypothetical protein
MSIEYFLGLKTERSHNIAKGLPTEEIDAELARVAAELGVELATEDGAEAPEKPRRKRATDAGI